LPSSQSTNSRNHCTRSFAIPVADPHLRPCSARTSILESNWIGFRTFSHKIKILLKLPYYPIPLQNPESATGFLEKHATSTKRSQALVSTRRALNATSPLETLSHKISSNSASVCSCTSSRSPKWNRNAGKAFACTRRPGALEWPYGHSDPTSTLEPSSAK
jgi:hypothetical protein